MGLTAADLHEIPGSSHQGVDGFDEPLRISLRAVLVQILHLSGRPRPRWVPLPGCGTDKLLELAHLLEVLEDLVRFRLVDLADGKADMDDDEVAHGYLGRIGQTDLFDDAAETDSTHRHTGGIFPDLDDLSWNAKTHDLLLLPESAGAVAKLRGSDGDLAQADAAVIGRHLVVNDHVEAGFPQAAGRPLGKHTVLKTPACQGHPRFADGFGDGDEGVHQGVVKPPGNDTRIDPSLRILEHGLPGAVANRFRADRGLRRPE